MSLSFVSFFKISKQAFLIEFEKSSHGVVLRFYPIFFKEIIHSMAPPVLVLEELSPLNHFLNSLSIGI